MFNIRSKVFLSIAGLFVVSIVAATYAVAGGSSESASSLKWDMPADLGLTIESTPAMATFAAQEGIATNSMRQIVASATGLKLVIGTDFHGRPCTAEAGTATSNFTCVTDWSDRFAMIVYSTDGGSRPFVADHASVVGLARPDVTELIVTTVDGAQLDLPLNEFRGFSYDASTRSKLPRLISAFDKAGKVVGTEQVE